MPYVKKISLWRDMRSILLFILLIFSKCLLFADVDDYPTLKEQLENKKPNNAFTMLNKYIASDDPDIKKG